MANEKKANKLGDLFTKNLNKLSSQISGSTLINDDALDDINKRIDRIITNELQQTKSITSDDMSTFMVKLFNDFDNRADGGIKNMKDIFEEDSAGLFQFFQQRYQNQNLLYEDLEMISSQLFELDEAINTTRDSIITSEDISNEVARTLEFGHIADSDKDNVNSYVKLVEKMEEKNDLNRKIKSVLVPNALRYGKFYVYACPYSKLFEEQYNKKLNDPLYQGIKDKKKHKSTNDPTSYSSSLTESISVSGMVSDLKQGMNNLYEGYSKQPVPVDSENKTTTKKDSPKFNIKDDVLEGIIKEYTNDIDIVKDIVSIPLVEGTDISELMNSDIFNKKSEEAIKNAEKSYTADAVVDPSKAKGTKFDNINGCYIKFIEPKKIIPIKILNTVIGYYYINGTDFQVNKSPFSTTIRLTSMNGMMAQNSEDVESMFLSSITDKIVKAFDKPFLEKNTQFKNLILDALTYNDMYKRRLTFQFIPAEYIQEFNVNPDSEGDGQSILSKSLFYAKLYLSLLIFKMITIITKSNDTKIYYVRNSGIDSNITNKVQEVARSIKSRQINFMDLLNYNSIISKIGAYKELFVPVGRSGEKGIDFDILSGQDVQLNTDLMESLRTNMINSTGR